MAINALSKLNPPIMAATTLGSSSCIVSGTMLSGKTAKHPLRIVATSKLHQLQQAETKITPQLAYTNNNTMKRKSIALRAMPPTTSSFHADSLSPAQTIMEFYTAINDRNLKRLERLIAEDCFFEDHTFPTPFRGKKEVLHFLERVIMCMGDDKNMQFNVEHVCEGKDYTAAVNWHLGIFLLEKMQVPFTRGCSSYSLSVTGNKLVIKKAQILIESPIKLGVVALTIFKIVNSLFDAFPAATEWFLKSPHIMFHLLLKAYNKAIQPIISPFLAWYIKLLKFAASILSFTFAILHYLAKIYRM